MSNNEIEIIAKAIGYHFWKPESDDEAISCGMDCAREVLNMLDDYASQPSDPPEQAKSKKLKWWCCKAEFGEHEPTCENYF